MLRFKRLSPVENFPLASMKIITLHVSVEQELDFFPVYRSFIAIARRNRKWGIEPGAFQPATGKYMLVESNGRTYDVRRDGETIAVDYFVGRRWLLDFVKEVEANRVRGKPIPAAPQLRNHLPFEELPPSRRKEYERIIQERGFPLYK